MTPVSYVLSCILALLLAGGVVVVALTGIDALAKRARRRMMRRELSRDWWPRFEGEFRSYASRSLGGPRAPQRGR
jgi:hypothetical protein